MARLLLLSALLALVLQATAVAGERKVPRGFMGTMADGPMLDEPVRLDAEVRRMVRSGVERLRLAVYWDEAQPDPLVAPDFARAERIIGAAARHELPVLVTILRAPAWARKDPGREYSPPADPVAYGRFAGQVAARFGRSGSFWAEHPELPRTPVRDYQIWNEPAGFAPGHVSSFWDDPGEPYAKRYVAMLRAARTEIRRADPHAQIILAGLFGQGWRTLPPLLAAGADGLYDQLALHVFTAEPRNLLTAVALTRRALRRDGARQVPVLLTEMTWTASAGRLATRDGEGYETTRTGQAQRLKQAYALLAKRRRALGIAGAFWYTWMSGHRRRDARFDYAGLRRRSAAGRVSPLPAEAAYRVAARRLQGCAKRRIGDC